MIISASYKTDIPAFYGPWFMARLKEGRCRMVNPWGGQVYEVDLTPEAVYGIVFWTKNLRPFRPHLSNIRKRFPFIVQYTVNGYPRPLEPAVVKPEQAIEDIRGVAGEFGPRTCVWRYDPILLTSLTPAEWHRHNFSRLAQALSGVVDEVIVSFTHVYRKTRRNLEAASHRYGFTWEDPDEDTKRHLVSDLAGTAVDHGMVLSVCAQPSLASVTVRQARCIDTARLEDVAGYPILAAVRSNRPGCLCAQNRDIGHYDTCPHGCVYCYAVDNRARAKRNFAQHDAANQLLLPSLTNSHSKVGTTEFRVLPASATRD